MVTEKNLFGLNISESLFNETYSVEMNKFKKNGERKDYYSETDSKFIDQYEKKAFKTKKEAVIYAKNLQNKFPKKFEKKIYIE